MLVELAELWAMPLKIDGLVRVLPPAKPSKRYRAGEIIRATVVSSQGHDLSPVGLLLGTAKRERQRKVPYRRIEGIRWDHTPHYAFDGSTKNQISR